MRPNAKCKNATRQICFGAIIATLYILLTYVSAMIGLDKGIIQLRLSEALCIFAVFTPSAIAGVTVGCLVSNLLCGAVVYDIIFGTLATLVGMIGVRLLRKLPYLAPLPYVLANSLIIPLVLRYAYGVKPAFYILLVTVGIGELVCAYGGGLLLYAGIKKNRQIKDKIGGSHM